MTGIVRGSLASGRLSAALRVGDDVVIGRAGFSIIDRIACVYLAAPVALFWIQWAKPQFALPLAAAALAGVPALLRSRPSAGPPTFTILIAFLLALGWSAMSGAGHLVYANSFDWVVRDAVFHDLATRPTPVGYAAPQADLSSGVLLRAPVAYYVVPAALVKITAPAMEGILLLAWTTFGVFLFLMQVLCASRDILNIIFISICVIFFSGLGILPQLYTYITLKYATVWWAQYYQYSPSMTLLFWVPNHALPGWLSIGILYRAQRDRIFVGISAWLATLVLLWSPLVAIGLLPFCLNFAIQRWRNHDVRSLFTPVNVLAAPLLAAAASLYLLHGTGQITNTMRVPPDFWTGARTYFAFVVIEFGITAYALLRFHREGVDGTFFWTAVATLLTLPLFRFGPSNDLVMRSSIPALAVLMFSMVDGWARTSATRRDHILIPTIIFIGAALPIEELKTLWRYAPWSPNLHRTVWDVAGGESPNYLTKLRPTDSLTRLLKPPQYLSTCPVDQPPPPHPISFRRPADARGAALTLSNQTAENMMAKLRDARWRDVASVWLPAGTAITIAAPPRGDYFVQYATGDKFSSSCEIFTQKSSAHNTQIININQFYASVILDNAFLHRNERSIQYSEFIFN